MTWGLGDVFHFTLHLLGLEVHSPQALYSPSMARAKRALGVLGQVQE